jgi:hypothetical protein
MCYRLNDGFIRYWVVPLNRQYDAIATKSDIFLVTQGLQTLYFYLIDQ